MATRTGGVNASVLGHRLDILNRYAAGPSPAHQVFGKVGTIIALIKDRMIVDEEAVQLSEYCFNACETLKTAVSGKDAEHLNEAVTSALEDLNRVMCGIERTLRRVASTPHAKFNKDKVEGHKLEIRQLLDVIAVPSTQPGDDNVVEDSISILPDHSGDTATTSFTENACTQLIRRTFTPHELPLLIDAIFSSDDEGDMILRLSGDDAQNFTDVIDEALETLDLSPRIRKKCLKALYRTCGRNAILPRSSQIPHCYDRQGVALCQGGFADVWKGRYRDRDVAVKVIRTFSQKDLQRMVGRLCKEVVTWKALRHPNVLPLLGVTMNEVHFAMVSEWMENGNLNEFLKANPDANRLELLADVARGLIYIHDQEMVHGDLKGANILIDQTRQARVADFSLLTIVSDSSNQMSSGSHTQGGTARWMSPELIEPKRFGCETSRPTRQSDCYALGMVIYEAITGHFPFHKHADLMVFLKVLGGKRPSREAGFTDSLWEMVGRCWEPQPSARPGIDDVLQCLERDSDSAGSHPEADGEMEDGDGWDSMNNSFDTGFSSQTEGDSRYEFPPDTNIRDALPCHTGEHAAFDIASHASPQTGGVL